MTVRAKGLTSAPLIVPFKDGGSRRQKKIILILVRDHGRSVPLWSTPDRRAARMRLPCLAISKYVLSLQKASIMAVFAPNDGRDGAGLRDCGFFDPGYGVRRRENPGIAGVSCHMYASTGRGRLWLSTSAQRSRTY